MLYLDNKYKAIAAKFAREGKTKLELMLQFPKATLNETKEIYLFYQLSKEINNLVKSGENDDVLKRVIVKVGFSEDDLDLIKGKKELKNILSLFNTTIFSLIFILLFVFVVGSLLINTLGQTDWDFLKKDYQVTGMFFGDDTNFDDLKISSNSTIKNVKIMGSEYSATIRCSKEVLISFSKIGFAPIHKKINCESQELDIVLPLMNAFKEIDLNKNNSVEDRGIKLDLNGNDLIVIGTNKIPINPQVSLTGFNPNTPGDMQYFPGELEGETSDGNVTALESYGFAKIVLQDESGSYLDFKEGKSATVKFPLDPNQRLDAPSEMPLWYFDEEKGIWVEEGIAKKVCNGNICEYIGEITKVHSWHNADYPIEPYRKDLNDWGIKGSCEQRLEDLKKSKFWETLIAAENARRVSGKKLTVLDEAAGIYTSSTKGTDGYPNFETAKIMFTTAKGSSTVPNYLIGSVLALRVALQAPTQFFLKEEGYSEHFNQVMDNRMVTLNGQEIDMAHTMLGFVCPWAGAQSFTDYLDVLIQWDRGQANMPDLLGNKFSQEIAMALPAYKMDHEGKETSVSDFFEWYFERCSRVEKAENEVKNHPATKWLDVLSETPSGSGAMGGSLHGFFTFTGKDFEFGNINGINVYDGKLILQLIDDVYLTNVSELSGNNDFSVIAFVPFATIENQKIVLIDSIRKDTLELNPPENGFEINYGDLKEIYEKEAELFLLKRLEFNEENGVKIFNYSYDRGRLESITFENMEKVYFYEDNKVSKIVFKTDESIVFEYNFYYVNKYLTSITYDSKSTAGILKKLIWNSNSLELNDGLQSRKIRFNENKTVSSIDNILFDYSGSEVLISDYGFRLSSPLNKIEIISFGQNLSKNPVKFENLGKKITISPQNMNDEIVLSINGLVSNKYPSNTSANTTFEGFKLSNCESLKNYPLDFFACIKESLAREPLISKDISAYLNSLQIKNQDKAILLTKLANYFIDLNFCYPVLGEDYYSGLACIKQVDNFKVIYSSQIIPNILNKNLSDYDLSFVLRNLSEYYMDRNYCLPIPTESQRLACLAKFPEPFIPIVPTNLCGNGVIDGNEKCDGINFDGKDCSSFGFNSGVLSCYKCQINKGNCSNISPPQDPEDPDVPEVPTQVCGNNLVEGNEDCDGTNFDGATCSDYGFNSGNLSCDNCRVNDDACVNTPAPTTCGNGTIEGNEQCDGSNLNGKSCATYGFNTGNLSCNSCQIINTNCSNTAAPPVEIDPLQIFDCNYNENYSSPIKDIANSSFWIKEIENGKVFALKIPFKKTSCVGETVLTEDESGNIVPCVTQLNDIDGCILEKRELSTISSASDNYVVGGKHNSVYKQNPVDFVGGDGNVYFLIKSNGKHEYIKFNPINLEINEKLQVYSESDYSFSTIPNVFRSIPSGNLFWIILESPLTNVKVERDSWMKINVCKNTPFTESSGVNNEGIGYYRWGISYDYGSTIFAKNYSGETNANIKAKARCEYQEEYLIEVYLGWAYLRVSNFDSPTMTYAGDGFGNLMVRSSTNIREYSIDSNDVEFPSAIR